MFKFLKQLLEKSLTKPLFIKLLLPILAGSRQGLINKKLDQKLGAAAKNHTDKKELVELELEQLEVLYGGVAE